MSAIATSVAGAAEAGYAATGASAAETAAAALELELVSEEVALAATEATVVSLEAAEFAALASGPLGWIAAAFVAVLAASAFVILKVESSAVSRDQMQYDYYIVHNPPPPVVVPSAPLPQPPEASPQPPEALPQPPSLPPVAPVIKTALQQVAEVLPSSYTRVVRGKRYNCLFFPY